MQKDSELDSILQEARESYQKRIDDLKFSLKTISSQEKDPKSEFEKFSPFKNTDSNSLNYSTTFRPSHTELKKSLKPSQSEDFNFSSRISEDRVLANQHKFEDLTEEVKHLNIQLSDMQENLERVKSNYEEAENMNTDLRTRIKDLTINLNKASEENSRLKELKNDSSTRELQNLKVHYKKKVARMREELLTRDSEIQKMRKEIDTQSRLQTSIRQVCETQVKEISEEYAKSLKQAGSIHNEEMIKLKLNFDSISEAQIHEFLKEMEVLKAALMDYEQSNMAYKEKFERLILTKEQTDKFLREKEHLLAESQVNTQQLRKEIERFQNSHLVLEKSLRDKETQLAESQLLIQKLKTEYEKAAKQIEKLQQGILDQGKVYEDRIKHLTEENWKKQQCVNKLLEELDRGERIMSKLKQDFDLQLEEEKTRSHSFEIETQELDSAFNELKRALESLKYKNSLLENQLEVQNSEFKKTQEYENSKHSERIKVLENELKAIYSANSLQAKEVEMLKQLCGEIEVKQEKEIRELIQIHQDNLREMKKGERSEYLKLCEALEATKLSLHHAESNLDNYEKVIKEMKDKEKGYLGVLKNVENYKRQTEEAVAQYRTLTLQYTKTKAQFQNTKDFFLARFKKLKDCYKACIKNSLDHFQEFKNFQEKSLSTLLKTLIFQLESLKNTQSSSTNKMKTENISLKSAFEKAQSQVSILEKELQSYSTRQKHLEDQNRHLQQSLDSTNPEIQKSHYVNTLKSLLSSMSLVESCANESFSELEASVLYLKDFITQDGVNSRIKQQDTIEQAKKSIDFYRDKLIKLENEKTSELNRSQNELFSLQQRLSQVLEDIRDQKF